MNELILVGKVLVGGCLIASLYFLFKEDWKKSAQMTLNAALILLWLIVIAG